LPTALVVGNALVIAETTTIQSTNIPTNPRLEIPPMVATTAFALDALRIAEASFDSSATLVASTRDHYLTLQSTLVWNVPNLRPMQLRCLNTILLKKRIILIDKTSGGKSHSLRMLGTLLKGIHLIFHPVLAMTADQMIKFECGSDKYGLIEAYNLDEIANSKSVQHRLIAILKRLKKGTTTTIFLFSSPQFLCKNRNFCSILINLGRVGMLRSVAIDEVHLWAKHGSSFRSEIRQLKNDFFDPTFKNSNRSPLFVGASATLSNLALSMISELTTIEFPIDHCVWAEYSQFEQDSIHMSHNLTSTYTKQLDKVIDYLADNEGTAFIYCNSKSLTHKLLPSLEAKIDDRSIEADVIHIHGSMSKTEKISFTKLLEGAIVVPVFHPRVLLATAAADVAIDHPQVELVLNMEWPDDIPTLVQRRGRASRGGQPSKFILVAALSAHISKVSQIYRQLSGEEKADNEDDLIAGYSPLRPTNQSSTNETKGKSYELTTSQRKRLVENELKEYEVVLNLFCVNRGCQHRRIQQYLACGEMRDLPPGITPCGTSCDICTNEWKRYFLPVVKEHVVAWLECGLVRDTLPCEATCESLLNLLWNKEHKTDPWLAAIFNRAASGIRKYHVEAFCLHLIANKIFVIEQRQKQLYWSINREPVNLYADRLCYQNDAYWTTMHLLPRDIKLNHKIPTLQGTNL